MIPWLNILLYLLLAPVVGGLLSGLDRIISARMQSRQGPPILQPFYDVSKLWQKQTLVVRSSQNFFIVVFLAAVIFTGGLFFSGSDLLLVVFGMTLAAVFFIMGAFKGSSPFSFIGAQRELIQVMAYEPMILLAAIGMYMATRSFQVAEIAGAGDHAAKVAGHTLPLVFALPGIFLGLLYMLIIKFRKSPFDLSSSHHAHQELVRGATTEFSGRGLALIEIAHWYESVLFLGWVYLFFATLPVLGIAVALLVFVLIILVDNVFARLKWQAALKSAWLVTLLLGFGNIVVLSLLR